MKYHKYTTTIIDENAFEMYAIVEHMNESFGIWQTIFEIQKCIFQMIVRQLQLIINQHAKKGTWTVVHRKWQQQKPHLHQIPSENVMKSSLVPNSWRLKQLMIWLYIDQFKFTHLLEIIWKYCIQNYAISAKRTHLHRYDLMLSWN